MRVRSRLLVCSVLCFSLIAARASAQTAATISGTVEDPDRRVLPGVTVAVRNVDTALIRTVATGPEGRYVIAGLPPGVYDLRAELTSFRPHIRRGLQLTVGQALIRNFTL
jgi:Carboxypeptidase regulatory-like domain